MSLRRRVRPGAVSEPATRAWWRRPGGMRFARGAWLERKMQRQKIVRHHGAVDGPVAAAVRDDEAGRWVPRHQALDIFASEVHPSAFPVIGPFRDDMVRSADQRLQLS